MMPLVTVVMATKNSESTISESLNSIQSQSFKDYEVIVIDGNSTDQTLAIAARYPFVRVIQQSGVGFADAWNCGIKEARGKYISFLDSDDIWDSKKLKLQVDFLELHQDISAVISRVKFFSGNEVPLPSTFRPELLQGSHVAHMPGAVMVRCEVFDSIGFFDPALTVASDIDWFAKLKDAGFHEALIDQVLIHKRVHQNNLSYNGAKEIRYDRELLLTLRRSIVRQREETANRSSGNKSRESWPAVSLNSREQFVSQVREHVTNAVPYAAGKLGTSETKWLYYPLFLKDERNPIKRAAYNANLRFHAMKQSGVFPGDPQFLERFVEFYIGHLRNIDSIGLFGKSIEREIIARHNLTANFIYYQNQEPDRKLPADEGNCYLPSFRGKRVLILSPFASLLCENATAERFTAVWRKTGKSWFEPAAMIPVEFPYGWAKSTQAKYPNVMSLYDEICEKISRTEFDVALVGAGALNIPLVSHIKQRGKVGIALGGHLQALFGILGKRWLDRPDWMESYVTDAWLPMKEKYIPDEADVADQGAYW